MGYLVVMPTKTALGAGYGRIVAYEDGTAAYYQPMAITQAFRVRIADVSGFTVTRGRKMLTRELKVLGRGTELASTEINHGVAERIEEWFRSQPSFNGNGANVAPEATTSLTPALSVADELTKLAALRDSGVLSEEEFQTQRQKLLD